MFTGIIRATSKILKIDLSKNGLQLEIVSPKGWKVKEGESISINGICSTVVRAAKSLTFQYMPETLAKTNAITFKVGDLVNLETSLKVSDTLDGHIVMGHIDSKAKIKSISHEGNSQIFKIQLPEPTKLLAPKGSVTIDGISLTTVEVNKNFFTVHVIPYTLTNTNLGQKKVDDTVNIEFDILAKYINSQYATRK